MFRLYRKVLLGTIILAGMVFSSTTSADTLLMAPHQFPGGRDDARDKQLPIIAREASKANVALKIQVYPVESLFKAKEQWSVLTQDQLDNRPPAELGEWAPPAVHGHTHVRLGAGTLGRQGSAG